MTADLALAVRQARTRADTEAGQASVIGRQGKAARAEAARLRESLELHEKVLGVLTSVGEARQESAQRQVEALVTRALQAIFGEELSFHLVPSVKGSQAVIDFVLRSRYGDPRSIPRCWTPAAEVWLLSSVSYCGWWYFFSLPVPVASLP